MTKKNEDKPCDMCGGCKQIANTDEGEPWSAWAELPPGSDLAVRLGIVKPIPCPVCATDDQPEMELSRRAIKKYS